MTPEDPSIEDVGARLRAVRLVEALGGLDLTSADGRAGIGSLLSEIERLSPAMHQQAARRHLGISRPLYRRGRETRRNSKA